MSQQQSTDGCFVHLLPLAIVVAMIIGNCIIDRRLERLESAVLNQTQPVLQPGHVYLLHDSLFFKSPDGEVILIKPASAYQGLPIQSSGNVIYPSDGEIQFMDEAERNDSLMRDYGSQIHSIKDGVISLTVGSPRSYYEHHKNSGGNLVIRGGRMMNRHLPTP